MRARRPAVSVDESAPADDVPVIDASAFDDAADGDADDADGAHGGALHVCLACGGGGGLGDGCDHAEMATVRAPSRAVRDAVARLQRAAAEQRQARRALGKLVASECARGNADVDARPAAQPAVRVAARATDAGGAEPCPRCAATPSPNEGAAAGAAAVVRRFTKRVRATAAQEAFAFAREPGPEPSAEPTPDAAALESLDALAAVEATPVEAPERAPKPRRRARRAQPAGD